MVFVETASEITFEDGLFHIKDVSGEMVIHRVLRPATYVANMEMARRAYAEFERGQREAVSIRRKRKEG